MQINGTPGNDILSTSTSGDFIDAGAGNDQVTVVFNVSADGGAGDDLVTIDLHADSRDQSFQFTDGGTFPYSYIAGSYLSNFESFHVTTGSGNDTGYFYPAYTTSIWGPDVWDAGAGADTLIVDMTNTTSSITAGYVNATTYQVTQSDPSSPVLMTAYNVESVVIVARNGANGTSNTLSGGAGDDQLISYAENSILNGGDGNDFLVAYRGGTLDGGNGFDTISTGTLPAYLSPLGYTVTFNGDGTITLTDPFGTRLLKNIERVSLGSDSVLLGSLANDIVTLPDGHGYMGGPGNDTINVTFGTGDHLIDGGAGNDTVLFNLSFANYAIGINSKGDFTVAGRHEYPVYLTTLVNVETVKFNGVAAQFGTSGDDVLTGTGSDDILVGGGGNDTLDGAGGNDTAAFSNTYDTGVITFNLDGSITVAGPDGTDTLRNIENASFSDKIVVLGTLGDDTVTLGSGDDIYLGGAGNDTITVGAAYQIIDGGTGNDTVLFSSSFGSYAIGWNSNGDVTVTNSGNGNVTTLVNVELTRFNGVAVIFGGNGNDSLTGTSGDDMLFGGFGNDTMDGGAGNDTAVFSSFGNYNYSTLTFNPDGSVTVTGPDGTDTLRNIENVAFADQTAALGTIGNDSVILDGPTNGGPAPGFAGGPGNDTVTANAGSIFFDGGPGTDTIILPFDYQGVTPYTSYPQTYVTQIGLARLMNVEIVQFNNATATLSNGQLTFTAAQPVLNNNSGTVQVPDTGYATTLAAGMTLSNPGGSLMTGAVIKIASGFVDGDILSADLTGTSISASYDAASGTMTLSGADTAAHYQQVLRSVQMTANATYNNHPSVGSVTWQVTNSDASHNASVLVTTNINLSYPRINFAQIGETVFISGLYPNGTIAPQSFATWLFDAPAQYDSQHSDAAKWGSNTPGTAGGTVSYYFDPASGWTATEQTVISASLALWSAEANISFALTANPTGAGITFVRGHDGGAYTHYGTPAGDANAGQINGADLSQFTGNTISIDTSVPGFGPIGSFSAYGGYVVNTVLHEEGHALGLGHAGPYNEGTGGNNFDSEQQGSYDSLLWSLMSYIDPQDPHARWYGSYSAMGTNWGTTTESTGVYGNVPTTPMALDIAAAQLLYGAPVNSPLSGGQVFGFNTNITGAIRPFFDFTQNTNPIVTLWDMGANNTLDLSGFSTNATVNLNPGTFSSADGMINNISIALNTKIDNFVGGAGNDVVTANNNGDALFGGPGNDVLTGGLGNDTLDGGPGLDKVIYQGNSGAYTITHNANGSVTITGAGGTDTLTHIETAVFNDRTLVIGSIPVADFNGQGRSDLVWQNIGGQPVVWLMNGTTVLSQAAVGSNPGPTWHVKGSGDFDGDGNADIVWQNDSGQAQIWFLNGASIVDNQAAGSNPGLTWHIIATGDFNSDGRSDMLWQSDSGQAVVWLMNGATVASSAAVGSNPGPSWHVKATGDFDGDGKTDILWQNDSGQAAIWLMNGTAMTGGAVVGSNPGASWHVVGAGDFDGDLKADILWQNNSGQVQIWLMNGTTVSSTNIISTNPGANWHIKGTADLNGDGKADILWQSNSGQAMAWLMNGTTIANNALLGSNPGPSWQIANYGTVPIKIANDFDGDHNADLLWQSDSGQAALWFMNGTSMVSGAAVGSNPGPSWHVKGAGDFDGDGKADILWQNDNGQPALWLMNGSTVAGGAAFANNPGPSWHVMAARDFDGDGKADIVWQNDSGQVALWFINGTTLTSGAVLSPNPGSTLHVKGAGDFDGDGKSDLLLQDDSGQAAIWLMNGSTVSSNVAVGSNPGTSWHVKATGDFDGDGKSDILWQNDSGQAAIWFMNGTTISSTALAGANPGPSWQVKGTSDLNGDGMSDILWQSTSGQAAAWMMSGTNVLSSAAIGANPGSSWHLIASAG